MWKESIICVIIIIAIIVGNYITQNYTVQSVESINGKLGILRDELSKNESDIETRKFKK